MAIRCIMAMFVRCAFTLFGTQRRHVQKHTITNLFCEVLQARRLSCVQCSSDLLRSHEHARSMFATAQWSGKQLTYEPWFERLIYQDIIPIQLKAVLILGNHLLYCQQGAGNHRLQHTHTHTHTDAFSGQLCVAAWQRPCPNPARKHGLPKSLTRYQQAITGAMTVHLVGDDE